MELDSWQASLSVRIKISIVRANRAVIHLMIYDLGVSPFIASFERQFGRHYDVFMLCDAFQRHEMALKGERSRARLSE